VLRLPLIGDVVLKSETARFHAGARTLLKSGVPVVTALGVVRELAGNQVLGGPSSASSEGVRRGAGIAGPIREAQTFPAMAVH
jgi:type II secretory pathway component PulF